MNLTVFLGIAAFTYLFNLPFGYWRAGVRKLSRHWILAVHLPVPAIFTLRVLLCVRLEYNPLLVAAFFLGQLTGGKIRRLLAGKLEVSLCLIWDLVRLLGGKAEGRVKPAKRETEAFNHTLPMQLF